MVEDEVKLYKVKRRNRLLGIVFYLYFGIVGIGVDDGEVFRKIGFR